MQELTAKNKDMTMSSREIAELTGKQISHVHRDFKAMSVELEFPNNTFNKKLMPSPDMDLGFSYEKDAQGRISSINLNRELTLTLISGYSVKLRNSIIKRWQELESKEESKPAFQIPQTMYEALQLAADQAKQLELAAPKVAFVDNCVNRGQLMTATQIAQKHKMSAVKLNKFLDEIGGVYSKSVKRSRVFIQAFIDKGMGETKQTELGYSQALFTAQGEQWINERLINEGVI
jgi:phage antirepressor YoqD-like protein